MTSAKTLVFKIASLVLTFVLVASVFASLRTSSYSFTFQGFIEFLQTTPNISLDGISTFNSNAAEYANIPFIGPIILFLSGVLSIIAYAAVGILNLILFATWCLGYIFV